MENTPKLVLMTPEELENLIQNSVRKALGEQSPQSSSNTGCILHKPVDFSESSKTKIISKWKVVNWVKIWGRLLSFSKTILDDLLKDFVVNNLLNVLLTLW